MNASSGFVLTLQFLKCLMSLTWAIKQIVAGRSWDPNLGRRVLGPCPCAGLLQACCVQRRRCIVFDSQISLAMVPKLLMNASSGLVLTLQSLDVSCHTLGSQACGYSQDVGPQLRGAGSRTMSLRKLVAVYLRRPVTGL